MPVPRTLAVLLVVVAATPACNLPTKQSAAADAGAATSTAAASTGAASTPSAGTASAVMATEKAMPPATVIAPPTTPLPGTPDLAHLLGTKADGWNPKVFTGLREGMAPAQAGKAFKYADAYDKFGIADIPVGNVKGVQRYRLNYLEGKLKFAEIWFDASLETAAFRDSLVKACKAKWGEPSNPGEEPMWIGPEYYTVNVSKIIDLSAKGWSLKIALR
jgi:hypothetical protein